MPIGTPRGLKVRLEPQWAFGLLARLHAKDSQTGPFRVLKTCEAIESAPSVLSIAGGVTCAVWPELPAWAVVPGLVGGRLLGVFLTQAGWFFVLRPTGLLAIAHLWSYVAGFGLLQVPVLVGLYLLKGWPAAALWVVGLIGAAVAGSLLEILFLVQRRRSAGIALTASEVNFFNAYRLHADRLGLTRDVTLTGEEIESEAWRECYRLYVRRWPEAALRFETP